MLPHYYFSWSALKKIQKENSSSPLILTLHSFRYGYAQQLHTTLYNNSSHICQV